jgi:transcriptional regulator with XRE-family HTH domain
VTDMPFDFKPDLEQNLRQLGEAVSRARAAKGMTVADLARVAHVGAGTITRIETGYGGTGARNLLAVLHALDLDPLSYVVDSAPAEELPLHCLHVDNPAVQEAIDEAVREACHRLDELFPGVPKEGEGIGSNFQGLLVQHVTAMLCGRQGANPGHLVQLNNLLYSDDLLGREYSLAEGADGYLVRLTGTDKVLEDGRFRLVRTVNDLYTSWDSAAAAVRKYVESNGHLPGPVRITSGWLAREDDGGARFSAQGK